MDAPLKDMFFQIQNLPLQLLQSGLKHNTGDTFTEPYTNILLSNLFLMLNIFSYLNGSPLVPQKICISLDVYRILSYPIGLRLQLVQLKTRSLVYNQISSVQLDLQCTTRSLVVHKISSVQLDLQCTTRSLVYNQISSVQLDIFCTTRSLVYNQISSVQRISSVQQDLECTTRSLVLQDHQLPRRSLALR